MLLIIWVFGGSCGHSNKSWKFHNLLKFSLQKVAERNNRLLSLDMR
jgi:hypothetical protein